ncbi:MAG: HlyD family efflux transporter periplasmic adaptor subunit, partial [Pseudomonadota bacterium]
MDKKIEKAPRRRVPVWGWASLALVPVVAYGALQLWDFGSAEFSIARGSVELSEVKRGAYTVSVRGSGVLVPDNVHWVSSSVEATVSRVAVKAGHQVMAGDLIVEMANPQLEQQLAEARWELEAMDAELAAAKAQQAADIAAQASDVMNLKLAYENAVLEYGAFAELVTDGVVSRLDYERRKLSRDQLEQQWVAGQDRLEKLKVNLAAQANALSARVNKARKSMEIIERQVADLQVRASLDSTVLEMPLEAGQRLNPGDSIAKLAQQNALIAELRVPEIQIRDVSTGQRVIIDTRNNKVEGFVSRIDPAVVNGNVLVDVTFDDVLPDDARPDLSVDGEILV